jgi:type II restriction/modification system DNA methylase subunit YeeA
MTPREFLTKWRQSELKERSASQSHFNDLCSLLGVVDPVSADPKGEWFTFEKGASKTSGGEGWADVWRKGCFAWEYKGRRKDLKAAFNQLLQYSVALENPPLLIVSDMDRILIHTNWTNTVQEVHEFATEDLLDASVRDRLKAAFTDPDEFKPAKTRQTLTEETAGEFAGLAQRLRERGHEPHEVAHFINRLVFCMFAEDVGLLPDHLFSKMLRASQIRPERFEANARKLFAAMATGGDIDFEPIDWFNGGLFDGDHAMPVTSEDIGQLVQAAGRDWSQIDPSILGTLFERGLDPAKRSQLGAHYTDRDKIMMIVRPVIIDPLEAEWADALAKMTALIEKAPTQTKEKLLRGTDLAKRTKALNDAGAIHSAFIERLANFRVLDPACGSGNFLYVALKAIKDIEHRANLDAEALGLPRGFPRVGPECALGIELNPYAAELARVSVWIGEIQWMRRNGFDAAKNPILRPLDTIECRDAVLNEDGKQAKWPEADVVIGNPPFLGASRMIGDLGEAYTADLRRAWRGTVPGFGDLVTFWFAKGWAMIIAGKARRVGLVATNSIRGGANREVLKEIVEHGRIFEAWDDEEWTVDGAAVRVSLICFDKNGGLAKLDGREVERINPDLTANDAGIDLTTARRLSQNIGVAFLGTKKGGPFDLDAGLARQMLARPINVNHRPNSDVLHRRFTGTDLARRPEDRWIVDFGHGVSEGDAALFEAPFEYVVEHVKPVRDTNRREWRRLHYWLHSETAPGLRGALKKLSRYIGTPRVSKYRLYSWLNTSDSLDDGAIAIARDDDTTFGILHSRFHELWSLRMGTFLGKGNDPRYTPSTTFETFPFPEGLTLDIPAAEYADDRRAQKIAAAAQRLSELRDNWLNPADLVVRVPEVAPGYPDRILPRDEGAAQELRRRTLTNLYNIRPQWLANAHAALDEAVADAYGWGDDWRAGLFTDDDILARVFHLNQERASASAN